MQRKWDYRPLSDVAIIKSGYTPSTSELYDAGDYPYFKVGDMNKEGNGQYLQYSDSYAKTPCRFFPRGAIVFPKNGAAIGTNKKRILKQDSVVDLNTAVLIPSDVSTSEFLYYWISQIDFRTMTRRGAVPTLDMQKLKASLVPSLSLVEQKRIVAELDLLRETIGKQKEQLRELDTLAQSVFYDMFGTTPEEKGWTVKTYGEIGTFQRGGGFLKSDYVEVGFPCLHYGQIHTKLGVATYHHLTCIPESLAKTKSKLAATGDVILAITSEDVEGSCKCTTWMGDYPIAVGGHTAIYKHSMNPIYAAYSFKSDFFQKAKEKYAHGFKVVEIKPSDIASIGVCIPPKTLQDKFAECVSNIELQKSRINQSIIETQKLFDYTMDKYFG